MSGDEVDISKSTPGFRFDVTAAIAPFGDAPPPPEVKPEIRTLVNEIISDDKEPIVMFALEWCEFCWSVRKMFAETGIQFKSVDLDSVAYQKDNLGGEIRNVLLEKINSPTIPQIFVGGEQIGGCTETFDAFNDGSLQKLMTENALQFDASKNVDAYTFLPKWLVAR